MFKVGFLRTSFCLQLRSIINLSDNKECSEALASIELQSLINPFITLEHTHLGIDL